MAKAVSSIVSLLGLTVSIFTNLINRVVALGGSEEMVRRLANPDNPLVQRIAEMIFYSEGGKKSGAPFKNWKAMCEALRARDADPFVIWANALADPQSHMGRRLTFAFPEFWSETVVQCLVPWSIFAHAVLPGNSQMVSVLNRFCILYRNFDFCREEVERDTLNLLPVECLDHCVHVGYVFSWNRKSWVVVQIFERIPGTFFKGIIVPAECLAMDI